MYLGQESYEHKARTVPNVKPPTKMPGEAKEMSANQKPAGETDGARQPPATIVKELKDFRTRPSDVVAMSVTQALPQPPQEEVRDTAKFTVVGCTDKVVGDTIRGTYELQLTGLNHGKPIYKRDGKSFNGFEVLVFYWDERDGAAACGWWFAPQIGSEEVWAYNPGRTATPPVAGWKAPVSAPVDDTLELQPLGDSIHMQKELQRREENRKRKREEGVPVCRSWLFRTCRKGEDCPYSHDSSAPAPTARKRVQCQHFARGDCWAGDKCHNLHGENDTRHDAGANAHAASIPGPPPAPPPIPESPMKTQICENFKQGVCRNGELCAFIHSTPVAPVAVATNGLPALKADVCQAFALGHCAVGDLCQFVHSTAVPPAPPMPATKTQMCQLFAMGHCQFGASCHFLHGNHPAQSQQAWPQQAMPQQSLQHTVPLQQAMPQPAWPQQAIPQQSLHQQASLPHGMLQTMQQQGTPHQMRTQQIMPQQPLQQQLLTTQSMPQQTTPQQGVQQAILHQVTPQQTMLPRVMPQQCLPQEAVPQPALQVSMLDDEPASVPAPTYAAEPTPNTVIAGPMVSAVQSAPAETTSAVSARPTPPWRCKSATPPHQEQPAAPMIPTSLPGQATGTGLQVSAQPEPSQTTAPLTPAVTPARGAGAPTPTLSVPIKETAPMTPAVTQAEAATVQNAMYPETDQQTTPMTPVAVSASEQEAFANMLDMLSAAAAEIGYDDEAPLVPSAATAPAVDQLPPPWRSGRKPKPGSGFVNAPRC